MSFVPRQRNHSPTVWLVEDNALFRTTVGALIEKSGRLRSRVFGNAEAALGALDDGQELPRLILMDLALPGMSGTECIRLIRLRAPAIPVVMLTVHQSNEHIFEAVCAGASGYLLKSASGDEILQAIDNVLEGGAAMDAYIARRVLEMFTRMVTPQTDYGLSERERQILQELVDGSTNLEIADRLGLSPHTIDGHVRNIYLKLHVNTRTGAVAKALKEHLL